MYSSRALSLPRVTLLAIVFLLVLTAYKNYDAVHSYTGIGRQGQRNQQFKATDGIPRRIWQIWNEPITHLKDRLKDLTYTWVEKNREAQYMLLNPESALSFVEDNFLDQPRIIDAFYRIDDLILRADFLRYLALYAQGGVYSDVDTECIKPIRDWIPAEHAGKVSAIIGTEFDGWSPGDDAWAQLCQWTIASQARHPVIEHVVFEVLQRLERLGNGTESIKAPTGNDVMETTGPSVFTDAVLDGLSFMMKRRVTFAEITMLEEPKLVGDVLILPLKWFASGEDNDIRLIQHHSMGWDTWKPGHPNREDLEKKKDEEEKPE